MQTIGWTRPERKVMSEYRKLLIKFYEGEFMPITAQSAAWLNRFVLFLDSEESTQQELAPYACPYCLGTGKGKMSGVEVGCNMCSRTGKIG